MKTQILNKATYLVVLLIVPFIFSCDDDDPTPTEEDYFITAKIDGVDFTSDFPVLLFIDPSFSIGGRNDSNTIIMQLLVEQYNGSGTYVVDVNEDNGNVFGIISDNSYTASNDSGSGTLTINEQGNLITGTFSFTATNSANNSSVNVTEGSFKVLKI